MLDLHCQATLTEHEPLGFGLRSALMVGFLLKGYAKVVQRVFFTKIFFYSNCFISIFNLDFNFVLFFLFQNIPFGCIQAIPVSYAFGGEVISQFANQPPRNRPSRRTHI